MPIKLETVSTLNPNDRNDLINIYEDYPTTIRSEKRWDPAQWIDEQLTTDQTLFTGRFNGRLLTAARANMKNGQMQLDHIAVIAISRRRGVATQLLTLLTQQATQGNYDLVIDHSERVDTFKPLLERLGFVCSQNKGLPDQWIYCADNSSSKS